MNRLQGHLTKLRHGQAIMSACTAHPLAIRAVLEHAEEAGVPALIEATANQVNQFGGYTGMLPADFALYIKRIAKGVDCDIILGGDHLGPLVWQGLPEAEAMENAKTLVEQYVLGGITKVHIDTSMRLKDDPPILTNEVIAARAAILCKRAEAVADPKNPPIYVIGSEVPTPGGTQSEEEGIQVTDPNDFKSTVTAFQEAFHAQGLDDVWERIVAVVVQPGVEFGDNHVFKYDREKAKHLIKALTHFEPLVFEGHSTDYQPSEKLCQMAQDKISILKVGPALTFAVREAMFALSEMEKWLLPKGDCAHFMDALENAMLKDTSSWKSHYHGTAEQQAFKRRFSFSDRARYYMKTKEVDAEAAKLLQNINAHKPPISLLSQYMPMQYNKLQEGKIELTAESLVKSRVKDYIDTYPIK